MVTKSGCVPYRLYVQGLTKSRFPQKIQGLPVFYLYLTHLNPAFGMTSKIFLMKILNRVTDIAMCVLKPCGLFRMADEGDTGEITTRRFVFA